MLPRPTFMHDWYLELYDPHIGEATLFRPLGLGQAAYYTLTTAKVSPYPFSNPFYAILNLAVGGDFDGNPDASTTFPQTMLVDYVRYYQYK